MHDTVSVEYDISGGDPSRVWFISDTHFDHHNIIKYCHRPFSSVDEMNSTIMRNWNFRIDPNDLVFFLGDIAFGRESRKPRWWLEQLNGRKVYLKGSHDKGIRPTSVLPSVILVADVVTVTTDVSRVCLVHEPFNMPIDWDGWVIHGHVHDNRPFVSPIYKRINVSVEAIDYKPRNLSEIREAIRGLA